MQGNEATLETFFFEVGQITLSRIESMRIDTLLAQRIEHTLTGHERNFSFGRLTAHEHGHFAKIWRSVAHAAPPIF